MSLYEILNKLNISYEEYSHQAVYTVDEARQIKLNIYGTGCKNLFLTDKQGGYYLVVLEENKRANIKELSKSLSKKRLSFASSDELKEILNLEPGSVTPLSIINDTKLKVTLLIDKPLDNNKILVHPNTNTKTLVINYSDLLRFIDYTNHKYILI